MKPVPTWQEIESLHAAFKHAAYIMAWGSGQWRPLSPKALQASRAAVNEFAEYLAKYHPPK